MCVCVCVSVCVSIYVCVCVCVGLFLKSCEPAWDKAIHPLHALWLAIWPLLQTIH